MIDAITDYYRRLNANVHRGAYRLAGEATDAYEGARARIAEFIKAGEWGPGFEAQNEMLDEHMKKYGLEDLDWRKGKAWYSPQGRPAGP